VFGDEKEEQGLKINLAVHIKICHNFRHKVNIQEIYICIYIYIYRERERERERERAQGMYIIG
jgi:hypothetical protein